MFQSIGLPELLVILVVVFLLFGARRLPELGSSLGRAIGEFKRGLHGESDKHDATEKLVHKQ